jgi:hypothetical protein
MSLTKVSFSMIEGAFVNVLDYGATGDGVTDDTAAIQAAIDVASQTGRTVFFPAGTYIATPATALPWEGTPIGEGLMTTAFVMRSNMSVCGEIGSVIKLANNCSTLATPKRLALFFTNSQLSNVEFSGLIFDMNGVNNRISPSAPASFNRYTQAAIHVSGTISGVAARIDNAIVENCQFLNTAGVTCIGLAQSNSAGVVLGKNWKIVNNLFKNNGLDTNDHSSIYAWADDVLCEGNTFTADTMFPNGISGNSGTLVAYEVHGSNQRFVNNNISNYYQGMWVGVNLTSAVENVVIANNTMAPLNFVGVDFFTYDAAGTQINKILIDGNTIGLDDTVPSGTVPDFKAAVQMNVPYGISNVQISNNLCSKTGTVKASAFSAIAIYGAVATEQHDNIVIKNNHAVGFAQGVRIQTSTTSPTNGIGYIEVSNNSFINFTPQGAFTATFGVSTSGTSPIDVLVLDGNAYVDTSAVPAFQYGTFLSGVITELSVNSQTFYGLTIADSFESGLLVTTRQGSFDKLSFTPVWKSGGVAVTLGDGTVQGVYTIKGAQITVNARITVGSTTVFTAGALSLDLPVVSAITGMQYFGNWRIVDSSATLFYLGTSEIDGTASSLTLQVSGGTFATTTSPITLATGDVVSVQITYNS